MSIIGHPPGSVVAGLIVLLLLSVRAFRIGNRGYGLPPGPATLPLIGNLHIFPAKHPYYKFTEWARQFGDIYSLMIGSNVVVVLTSMTAVREIVDRRSATTSDRPANYMANLTTDGQHMAISAYNDNWKAQRKAAQAVLSKATNTHLPIQKAEATQLMYDCLKSPQDFFNHIRRHSHSVILSIVYGKRSPRYDTSEASHFWHVLHQWEDLLTPGAHPPVDLLPFLKYVPERWALWKTLCKEVGRAQRVLYCGMLTECEERIRDGKENGSCMEEIVKRKKEFGLSGEQMAYLGGGLLEAGSDTTASLFHTVILLLVAFPEVRRKAQQEVDRVIGVERLPTLDDWAHLPYLQAISKETPRFRPVTPLALPHATTADEWYGGYLIPRGATVFINAWGINHDPKFFEDPETFNPDRYIGSEYGLKTGIDDTDFRHTITFGAGRRICAGINLANNSFMLNLMNFVWAFDISHALHSETQEPIPVNLLPSHRGIFTGPEPFQCSIIPRSAGRVEMIEAAFVDAIDTFLPFEESLTAEDKAWVAESRASFH